MKNLISNLTLNDRIKLPTARKFTDSGQLIVPCSFARTGTQVYSANQLGLTDRDGDTKVTVHRKEEAVFDSASMNSFRSVPVTIGHPSEDVTASNASELQKGFLEGLPTRDDDKLEGTLVLTDAKAIEVIDSGIVELSAGYKCDLYLDDSGDICQTNIRGNHIAIVPKGRAGTTCRIADEDDMTEKVTDKAVKEDVKLTDVKVEDVSLQDALTLANTEKEAISVKLADAEEVNATLTAKLDAVEVKLLDAAKDLDAKVAELSDTLISARTLADDIDYTGHTSASIKRLAVAKLLDIDLKDKCDAYVAARFDVLLEDSELDTPMTRVLRDNANTQVEVAKYTNKAEESRQKMITRHKA